MSRRLLLIALVILMTSVIFAQEEDLVEIEAVWTPEILVIVNTSDEDVDLSILRLVSELGEIDPIDWQMSSPPESSEPFSLSEVIPGSCLMAYQGSVQPALPPEVSCDLIIGIFLVSTNDDLIWDVGQGGFTPYLGETDGAPCSIASTSCILPVPLAGTLSEEDAIPEPEMIDITAIWNLQVFVLINTSGRSADIRSLTLQGALGEITPENWTMDFDTENNTFFSLESIHPGWCLVAHLGADRPPLPTGVSCTTIVGRFVLSSFNNFVWEVSQGGFTPIVNEVAGDFCSVQRSSCKISVINADYERLTGDLSGEGLAPEVETVVIEAIWNSEVFVLLNSSEETVDTSSLYFRSSLGEIGPENWQPARQATGTPYDLRGLAPGACMVAYFGETRPDLPEDVTCTNIVAEYGITAPNNLVWTVAQGGFTSYIGTTEGARCSAQASSCGFEAPVSN